MKADSEIGPDSESGPDFDKPIGTDTLSKSPAFALADATLLGARHDMSLVAEHATVACACVKLALGGAQSAAFQWQGAAPRLNDDIQLAFALSSENMACQGEPKGSSGASYWGYRIAGNDVIVYLEGVRSGRPRTNAAVIPKPVGRGMVYVAPAKNKEPYGRALDGKSVRCLVGNAATARQVPFTKGELGDTSARDANVSNDANGAPTVDAVE